MNSPSKDPITEPLEAQTPAELLSLAQWIAWWSVVGAGLALKLPNGRLTGPLKEKDKPHKLPINPRTGGLAASTRSTTWTSAEDAHTAVRRWSLTGVGFVFTDSDPYSGIDIDNCRDATTGEIAEWAWEIIRGLDSYTEVSPSRTGVHIIVRGKIPPGQGNQVAYHGGKVEMFSRARYFTISGARVDDAPLDIRDRQVELLALHARLFATRKSSKTTDPAAPSSSPPSESDHELIDRARRAANGPKFDRLWGGQWEGDYPSQSEADIALCCMLAFWTGNDAARMDALFRASGLMRKKWLQKRYRDATISRAIGVTAETWKPGGPMPHNHNGLGKQDGSPNSQFASASSSGPKNLEPEAYYGVAGELVQAIAPHTEADPAGLLIQLLVAFGNLIGRGPYFLAGADRHYTNEFAVMVGASSRGRKGSSWSAIQQPLGLTDGEWANARIQSGLSSGEGLIWAVRDAIEGKEPIRERKRIAGYQTVIKDHGVNDKRLMVVESEFAATLRVSERDGNTLSPVIRNAWDTGILRVLTKNSPAQSTGAHISIIGHITKDELLKYLTDSEAGNGFANRFLWIAVKRSKFLPEGGMLHTVDLGPLIRRLSDAVRFARSAGVMKRDDEASELWREVYPRLCEDRHGLYGAVTSRAEAHTLRVSCLFALMDCSEVVRVPHLAAALEVWRYSEDSCRHIFGDSLGDSTADGILAALRRNPAGLTRTEISRVFDRHKSADEITRALSLLREGGRAKLTTEATKGRSAERWIAI